MQTKYLPLGLLDTEDAGTTDLQKVVNYLPSEQKNVRRILFYFILFITLPESNWTKNPPSSP